MLGSSVDYNSVMSQTEKQEICIETMVSYKYKVLNKCFFFICDQSLLFFILIHNLSLLTQSNKPLLRVISKFSICHGYTGLYRTLVQD